jgi:hypothetical protein
MRPLARRGYCVFALDYGQRATQLIQIPRKPTCL